MITDVYTTLFYHSVLNLNNHKITLLYVNKTIQHQQATERKRLAIQSSIKFLISGTGHSFQLILMGPIIIVVSLLLPFIIWFFLSALRGSQVNYVIDKVSETRQKIYSAVNMYAHLGLRKCQVFFCVCHESKFHQTAVRSVR